MTDTVVPAPPASPAAVLGVVTDTVADLSDRLWAARSPAELLATVRAVETLRSVLDGLELAVVAEIDAPHAAATAGWPRPRTSSPRPPAAARARAPGWWR